MDEKAQAQDLVLKLRNMGLSTTEISRRLQGRVSSRTVHRWGKGEVGPGNMSDLAALSSLFEELSQLPNKIEPDGIKESK